MKLDQRWTVVVESLEDALVSDDHGRRFLPRRCVLANARVALVNYARWVGTVKKKKTITRKGA